MLLTEIFNNTNIEVTWHGDNAMFIIDEYQYIIQFIHMKHGDMVHGPISDQPLTPNTYFFAFAAQHTNGGPPIDTDIHAGKSIQVFSIIMQELQKFIERKHVDTLYFGCSAAHAKRTRIYQKIVNRYTATSGWSTISETQAKYFGEVKHIWIVQKQLNK